MLFDDKLAKIKDKVVLISKQGKLEADEVLIDLTTKEAKISMNNSEEKGVPASTLREITLLKQLDNMTHPNIVRYEKEKIIVIINIETYPAYANKSLACA